MEEYFNEKSIADLDFTGLEGNMKTFIEAHFQFVRSKRVRNSAFDHRVNLCLISNIEEKEKIDVKDKKLKAILESSPVLKRIYSELSKYQHYFKINLSATSVVLQENGRPRFIYAHKSNYLLLPRAYEIRKHSDIREFIFHLEGDAFLDPEKFFMGNSKSRRIVSPCIALHLACDQSRVFPKGQASVPPTCRRPAPKSTYHYRKKNNIAKPRGGYTCKKCGVRFNQSDKNMKHKRGPDNKMVCPDLVHSTSSSTSEN